MGSRKAALVTVIGLMISSSLIVSIAKAATPGQRLWLRRFDKDATDSAAAIAGSQDGSTVYVTGSSGETTRTVAYEAASGTKLWNATYFGPTGSEPTYPVGMALSADGSALFVAGATSQIASGYDYATVAYDTATGSQIWDKAFNGPGNIDSNDDFAHAVTATSGVVVVTGESAGATSVDYATVAYDEATGKRLWTRRYLGPGGNLDVAYATAGSPDGSKVFVSGVSLNVTFDYATIAYDAATGAVIWTKRFDGPGHLFDRAYDVAVAPDGSAVYVTGLSYAATADWGTIAYATDTGVRLWKELYDDPLSGSGAGRALQVSPDSSSVFVTGTTEAGFATTVYNAGTGAQGWVKSFDQGGAVSAVAVNPDGSKVAVTGGDSPNVADRDYLTIVYDAAAGTRLWLKRYDGPGHYQDGAGDVVFGADGLRLFVTGTSRGLTGDDWATLAYAT